MGDRQLDLSIYAPINWPPASLHHDSGRPPGDQIHDAAGGQSPMAEPITIFLVGTALLGLAGLGRRLQK